LREATEVASPHAPAIISRTPQALDIDRFGLYCPMPIVKTARAIKHLLAEEEPTYSACDVCGYVVDGDIPEKCPVCGNPKKVFYEVSCKYD